MKTKKFNTTLQKLNDLFSAIKRNPGEISPIERDLLRNYLMKLYDLSLEEYKEKSLKGKKEKKRHNTEEPLPKPSIEKEVQPIIEQEEPETNGEIQASVQTVEEELTHDPELEALFMEGEVKELSDKLSLSPILDLSKGMGINEKIFTIQELFGGDQSLFDATLKDLNGLENFSDAKDVLIEGVASKYSWASDAKKKKAANFIRFVRRRYV